MTNTSPITTTNFIAGVIGVSIALLIMPQIIMGTVGAQQKGAARSATNDLIEDINNVCGNSGEESGDLDLNDGYEIILDFKDYKLENPEDEVIEERTMACRVDTQTTLDSSDTDYTITSEENDYDDDGNAEPLYNVQIN